MCKKRKFLEIFQGAVNSLIVSKCVVCHTQSNHIEFCESCFLLLQFQDSTTPHAFLSYEGVLRRAILKAKFDPCETTAQRLLSFWNKCCVDNLRDALQKTSPVQAITFVPLHWRRRLSRGYDFSALFARSLGKKLHLPVWDLLQTIRFDEPLSVAPGQEERFRRVQGRYKLRKSGQKARHILLVDDIWTTGATLQAAQKILEAAGHQVSLCVFAKTPLRESSAKSLDSLLSSP